MSPVPELERMAEELAAVPDRFNDLFAERGWIIYDMMNVEIAKAAIAKAEGGDIDGAEADLVDYYNAETLEWNLQTMYGVSAFHPRMPLAQKDLTDYSEGVTTPAFPSSSFYWMGWLVSFTKSAGASSPRKWTCWRGIRSLPTAKV